MPASFTSSSVGFIIWVHSCCSCTRCFLLFFLFFLVFLFLTLFHLPSIFLGFTLFALFGDTFGLGLRHGLAGRGWACCFVNEYFMVMREKTTKYLGEQVLFFILPYNSGLEVPSPSCPYPLPCSINPSNGGMGTICLERTMEEER